jgi:hypothetical protein
MEKLKQKKKKRSLRKLFTRALGVITNNPKLTASKSSSPSQNVYDSEELLATTKPRFKIGDCINWSEYTNICIVEVNEDTYVFKDKNSDDGYTFELGQRIVDHGHTFEWEEEKGMIHISKTFKPAELVSRGGNRKTRRKLKNNKKS